MTPRRPAHRPREFSGLSPKGTDQVISTTATALKVLPIAARHPAQL